MREASSVSLSRTAETGPARVLLVEDNDTDVLVVDEVLKNCGCALEIRVASNGEAALECLGEFVPALILLDLNLPKLSGLEVLAEIRRRESLAEVPVVIVTSSNSASDIQSARELKVAAYFCKPASLTEFMKLAGIVRGILVPPTQIS